jgi:hypothetical protein
MAEGFRGTLLVCGGRGGGSLGVTSRRKVFAPRPGPRRLRGMGNPRKRRSGFQVTDRDLAIVRWLGRVKLGTVDHVRIAMGMGRTKAYERLAGLVEHGLVLHQRPVPGHGVYLASRKGLTLVGLELAPASVSLGALTHDLAVTGLVAAIEGRYPGCRCGPSARFVTTSTRPAT